MEEFKFHIKVGGGWTGERIGHFTHRVEVVKAMKAGEVLEVTAMGETDREVLARLEAAAKTIDPDVVITQGRPAEALPPPRRNPPLDGA